MIVAKKPNGRRPAPPANASYDDFRPVQAPPPDPAPPDPAPGDRRHHDPVTAVHDAIDFARALVQDGGTQTAGLTMLRGEIGHLQREIHAWRQELAATRQDVDRLRADLLRVDRFVRGVLVDRLAAKFAQIDAWVAGCQAGPASHGVPGRRDTAQMRAGTGPLAAAAGPGDGVDGRRVDRPVSFGR